MEAPRPSATWGGTHDKKRAFRNMRLFVVAGTPYVRRVLTVECLDEDTMLTELWDAEALVVSYSDESERILRFLCDDGFVLLAPALL
jgi:hypothetical protein